MIFYLTAWFLVVITYVCALSFDDAIENKVNIPKIFVNYASTRSRRSIDNYLPIRFHIDVDETVENVERLKLILEKATTKISQLISVIPVQGPLLLERTSCSSTWYHGINNGLCSSLRSKSKNEFCENKIDSFQIPDKHLNKLGVYSFSSDIPLYMIPAGKGVTADYILYVRSHFSSWCQKKDIQAYASYCRLDQYSRPVAGFINFCPIGLKRKSFNIDHFVNVAVHEIFHALGFSKDLFSDYKGCPLNDQTLCDSSKHFIVEDSHGIPRLTFPSVKKAMADHFQCLQPDFGAPLEKINGTYTSHFDSLLLYGSIMTSNINDMDVALIDHITLSVFEDTGWYHVNYAAADSYTWGKEERCNFGLTQHCDTRAELCSLRNQSIGCDFMHYTQTRCQHLDPSHVCGVYKPDLKNDCRTKELVIEGMALKDLRCVVTEEEDMVNTMCTAISCKSKYEMALIVDEKWIECPYDTVITVGKKKIICPKAGVFCSWKKDNADSMQSNYAEQISISTLLLLILLPIAGCFLGMFACFGIGTYALLGPARRINSHFSENSM